MNAHPIDDHEWSAFAGASPFPNGDRPLFAEGAFADGKRFALVINHEASTLTVEDHEQSLAGGWVAEFHPRTAPRTAAAAQALLAALGDTPTLDYLLACGYQPV